MKTKQTLPLILLAAVISPLQANEAETIHQDISDGLTTLVNSIDGFFGDKGHHEDNSELLIDLETTSLVSREQKHTFGYRLRSKIRLDQLNQQLKKLSSRIELLVTPEDPLPEAEQGNDPLDKKTRSSVHLQVSRFQLPEVKYQFGHDGFKDLFAGIEFDPEFELGSSQLTLNTNVRYNTDRVTQATFQPELVSELSDWQQNLFIDYQYDSDRDDQSISWGGNWRHQLSAVDAISFAANTSATTAKRYSSQQHIVSSHYRRKIYSDWVFLDAQLFNRWQKGNDFKADPGISLGLNIYFGR